MRGPPWETQGIPQGIRGGTPGGSPGAPLGDPLGDPLRGIPWRIPWRTRMLGVRDPLDVKAQFAGACRAPESAKEWAPTQRECKTTHPDFIF